MSDDSGKQELRLPFPFEEELFKVAETLKDVEKREFAEPNFTAEECRLGDWLFSSRELVMRNLRKKKTIRLENVINAQRLLSTVIALGLHPGYQVPQFITFLDKICQFHFKKGLVDAFCINDPDIGRENSLDWESIKTKFKHEQVKSHKVQNELD